MQSAEQSTEDLLLLGYRSLMAAYEFSDMSCWELVWQAYIAEFGENDARRLVGELQYWGRSIRQRAGRSLNYFPSSCQRMSDDEAAALALVSAAQGADVETGRLAAQLLAGCEDREAIQALWQASRCLGCALKDTGRIMCPVPSCSLLEMARRRKMLM